MAYAPLTAKVDGRAVLTTLFARPHVSRADDTELPRGRTLFVLNVPPAAHAADCLSAAFSEYSEVTAVHLNTVGDARTVHVVFAKEAGVKKALASTKPLQLASATGEVSQLPSRKRSAPASREELQSAVGAFMERFEAEEAERQAAEDAKHNQMDADGFVLVTRKRTGRSTSTDAATGATVGVASASAAAAAGDDDGDSIGRKKKKKLTAGDMPGFYHFQRHEKKREQLLKLREQFEADRARIAKMRADRKFKPQGY